jgi:hypothetical protein
MALQLGRARMINANDCTVKPPIDSDLPEDPSRTIFVTTGADQKPSHYTSACVKYYLSQQIHKMMSLGALNPGFNDYSIIQSLHAEVTQLLNDLPPAVRPETPDTSWDLQYPEVVKHRLQISIIASSFLLSLHRPLVARRPQSLELAISAAIQVLDASQLLFERTEQHQHKTYTLVFYTIDAGMLLSAMLAKFPREADWATEPAITALRQAVFRLSVLKERNPAAIAGEQVLTQCLERLGHGSEKLPTEPENHQTEPQRRVVEQGNRNRPHRRSFELQNAQGEESAQRPFSESTTLVSRGNTNQAESAWSQGQGVVDGQDLFAEIINDSAFTAAWLEQMNNISSMDFGFQDEDFNWSAVY